MAKVKAFARSIRGVDILLALAEAGVVILLGAVAFEPDSANAMPVVSGLAVTLGLVVLLAWEFPVPALCAAITALLIYHLAEFTPIGMSWPLVLPYVVVAARGHLRVGVIAAIVLSANAIIWRTWIEHEPGSRAWVEEALALAVVALALAVGAAMHQRQLWADEVRARLRQVAVVARKENDRLVTESRLAAAADLHDIAGHSLVAIGLHLQIAAETPDNDPVATREAVAAAIRAHQRALQEMSETVSLLRDGTRPPMGIAGETSFDVSGLQEIAHAAGIEMRVSVDLDASLAPDIAFAAHRILQEALTNTIRHSLSRHVTLSATGNVEGLRISFVDDGPAREVSRTSGHGLQGMRERVSQLGGKLDVGPTPTNDGFGIEAWLPGRGGRS